MPADPDRVQFVGPFTEHRVVIDGWEVPLINAHPTENGDVMIVIDQRLGETFTRDEAQRFVPFLADAIAVALGYGAHPRDEDPDPLARGPHVRPKRVHMVSGFEAEAVDDDGPPT